MNSKVEQAVENYKNGFNCSQAVLDPFCEQLSLDVKLLLRSQQDLGTVCVWAKSVVLSPQLL